MKNKIKDKFLSISKKQRELLIEYEELIEAEEDVFPFPPFIQRQLIIERKCLLEENNADFLNMMAASGQRKEGLKEIKDFTKNVEKLIVVDPYIFHGKKEDADKISDEFIRSARIGGNSLKDIHFIYNGNNVTNSIKKAISKSAKESGVSATFGETDTFHDRIWIADKKKGLVVGHSFNGLGIDKVSFLLPLPVKDLEELLLFLDENRLFKI